MHRSSIGWISLLLFLAAACSAPSRSPLYGPGESHAIFDAEYLGDWAAVADHSTLSVTRLGERACSVT